MLITSGRSRRKNWFEFSEECLKNLEKELKGTSKDYLLNVNEGEFKDYLFNKFSFGLLELHEETVVIHPPKQREHKIDEDDRRRLWRSLYYWECNISYQCEGTTDLWHILPTSFSIGGSGAEFSISGNNITIKFNIQSQDPNEFHREKDSALKVLNDHILAINNNARSFNTELPGQINQIFSQLKEGYLKENSFFAAINVSQNPDAPRTYSVPKVEKRPVIQKPVVTTKVYAPEPTVDGKAYHDIIDCLTRVGLSIERKPSLYVGKDEEALRDLFLMQLELAFVGGTATGETFNRSGKTDILLKNTDGTNLFVGECKVWKGQKHYLEALSQLLEYLTWDDSKTALLVFVKNPTLTAVIETVRQVTLSHPSAIRFVSNRNERFLQFTFKLPQDSQKHVAIEVMLFHFDKEAEGRG